METVYREAQELVDRIDEPQARAQLLSAYGFYRQFVRGFDRRGTADLERALELADEGDDLAARVVVRYALGSAYMGLQRYQDVLRLANEGLELLRDDPERASTALGFPSRAAMLFQKALGLNFLERVSEAGQTLELLQGEARAHAHPVSSWFSAQGEALLSLQVGDERRALAAAAEACTVSERTGNLAYRAWSVATLARAHAASGNHEEALQEGRRALEIVRSGNLAELMAAMILSSQARELVDDDPAAANQIAV